MRLSCDEVAGKLERLLDDELAPAEIRAVEGHLAGCAGCSNGPTGSAWGDCNSSMIPSDWLPCP